ncbi:unnamed protein product [Amaranthus hypochondriacus]
MDELLSEFDQAYSKQISKASSMADVPETSSIVVVSQASSMAVENDNERSEFAHNITFPGDEDEYNNHSNAICLSKVQESWY